MILACLQYKLVSFVPSIDSSKGFISTFSPPKPKEEQTLWYLLVHLHPQAGFPSPFCILMIRAQSAANNQDVRPGGALHAERLHLGTAQLLHALHAARLHLGTTQLLHALHAGRLHPAATRESRLR